MKWWEKIIVPPFASSNVRQGWYVTKKTDIYYSEKSDNKHKRRTLLWQEKIVNSNANFNFLENYTHKSIFLLFIWMTNKLYLLCHYIDVTFFSKEFL